MILIIAHVIIMIIVSIVTGSFLNTMKFVSKDCDPTTGEPDEGTGFDDEYVVMRGCGLVVKGCGFVMYNVVMRRLALTIKKRF